jgi:hypothetical protein
MGRPHLVAFEHNLSCRSERIVILKCSWRAVSGMKTHPSAGPAASGEGNRGCAGTLGRRGRFGIPGVSSTKPVAG